MRTHSRKRRSFASHFSVGNSIPLIMAVVSYFLLVTALQVFEPKWQWVNEHVYSVMDGLGGGISIFLGIILFLLFPYRKKDIYLPVPACALIGMGIFEVMGFFTTNIHVSLWLDFSSVLTGAFFLIAFWLPENWVLKFAELKWGSLILLSSLAVWILFFGESTLPSIKGNLLPLQITIPTFVSGVIFLASVSRVNKLISIPERQWVITVLLYMGLSGVTFPFLKVWGARWWLV